MPIDGFVSVEVAATALRTSTDEVLEMVARGEIQGFRERGVVSLRSSDVEAMATFVGWPRTTRRTTRRTKEDRMPEKSAATNILGWVLLALLALALLIFAGMWGIPQYSVWQQGLAGEAELKRAEQNRKIRVQEAEAKKDSASHLAEAEIIRARGVAEANQIIGESLKDNEAYLRYLWVQGLQDGSSEVIYIPTEAGMPILEAGKRVLGSAEKKQ
jgi:hypothetical protein